MFRMSIDQTSPEAVLRGFHQALSNKNWRSALEYMMPESRSNLTGVLLVGAAYASDGDAHSSSRLVELLQRHGLRKQEKAELRNVNHAKVISDLMQWSNRYLPDDKQLDLVENVLLTEYSNFRIKDDRAFVTSTCKGRKSEVRLKLVNKRWYLV